MTSDRKPPRRTLQRAAVRRALSDAPGFLSAQDLHQRLDERGTPIGLATVYRQLAALVTSEEADAISTAAGQLYRACEAGAHHHHHLICEVCGNAVEIEPPSEEWIRAAAEANGYAITRHVLEVFGLCPTCAATWPQATASARR